MLSLGILSPHPLSLHAPVQKSFPIGISHLAHLANHSHIEEQLQEALSYLINYFTPYFVLLRSLPRQPSVTMMMDHAANLLLLYMTFSATTA